MTDQSLGDIIAAPVGPKEGGGPQRHLRLSTVLTMRWIAVAGQAATVVFVAWVLRFPEPLIAASILILAGVIWNVAFTVLDRPRRLLTDRQTLGHLAFDVVQLSLLVGVTGGLQNPFAVLLAAPVVLAFTALPARYAFVLAGFAFAAMMLMWRFQGPLPWAEDVAGPLFDPPQIYEFGVGVAIITAAAFISLFAWRSAVETRRMSAALTATEEILSREQRLSALGGLAAAAAHELGTPLGTIYIAATELARFLPRGSSLHDDAALLASQAQRCQTLLRELTQRRTQTDPVHARLSVRDLLEEVVEPLLDIGPPIAIVVAPFDPDHASSDQPTPAAASQAPLQPSGPILRRSPEILYAIRNYIENALVYAQHQVTVTGRWNDHVVEFEVRDDGPGFSPDVIKKLGEPYVSDRVGGDAGLGLGFFIAQRFVERNDGAVWFGNGREDHVGAIVRARFPMATLAA